MFDYSSIPEKLLTTDIVNLLSAIHEYKGKQMLYIEAKADMLSNMLEIAKIQSTQSSNRIEGIYTSDSRLAKLVKEKTAPRNRNEKEIAGYSDVLATIHKSFDFIEPNSKIILQLHRDLYKYSGSFIGGHFKNSDNMIEKVDAQGNSSVRFYPLSAFETPEAVERLCDSYKWIIGEGMVDPLLIIPVFILDFLCIHPFNDGNGRMSRLLTLLLLYRADYIVGKYISIEMIIEKTKDSYYDALQASSAKWYECENDYKLFIEYYLGVILNAYKEFSIRLEYITDKNMTAAQRIDKIVKNKVGRITKKEIAVMCPDLNEGTVERALTALIKSGNILKIGGGRTTSYTYNYDKPGATR